MSPAIAVVWIKRKGVALDEVEPEDVIALDLEDDDAFGSPDYHLESVMHTEVYRARAGRRVGHPRASPLRDSAGATERASSS